MIKQKILDQVKSHLEDLAKNSPFQDMEKNLKSVVLAIFSKLDLVTREEFDTQQKVLLATRKKLEELEKLIKDLKE